ncbi:hypothetical protein [Clostridium beijerinckii]|uniref:hypothetical protein n=1 Tax=Clostridium beijerinckii TaxID=1520 RepID=UPI00156E0A08|nr:hypothetical protein [Clostridium beijerinckii]NRX89631.1 hypothetical protein [Clostridium beijerinckii]
MATLASSLSILALLACKSAILALFIIAFSAIKSLTDSLSIFFVDDPLALKEFEFLVSPFALVSALSPPL